jgi:hypothetical protein
MLISKKYIVLNFTTLVYFAFVLFSCQRSYESKIDKLAARSSLDLADTTANVKELIVYKRTSSSKLNNLPKALKQFIPNNYKVLDTISADLNLDGVTDFI